MKKIRKAYILNIAIVIFEIFALAWMMSGINGGVLSASKLKMLIYFTVDSNILMGIIAFIVALDERKVLNNQKSELSVSSYVLKLIGTVGVTLTMLVTVFFLAPTMGPKFGYAGLFLYSNFFLHLLNPILSIIVFLFYEKTSKISFKYTFTGIIPMLLYTIYYVTETLTHTQNGVISEGYDWYGFLVFGIKSIFIVIPILVSITYLISYLLWKINKLKEKK